MARAGKKQTGGQHSCGHPRRARSDADGTPSRYHQNATSNKCFRLRWRRFAPKAGGLCRRYGVAQGRGPARSPAVWSGGRAMSWDSPVWKAAAVEYRSNRVVNGGDASEDQSPAFSDDALALQFAELHEPRLRYVAQWNKWFFWDATCWKEDATLHYFNFSRQICRKATTACNKGKSANCGRYFRRRPQRG